MLQGSLTPQLMLLFQSLVLLGDVLQARILVAAALGHDAVFESYIGRPTAQFMHFERSCRLLADVESPAIAVWCKEHVIVDPRIHRLCKRGIEIDASQAVGQRARSEIGQR